MAKLDLSKMRCTRILNSTDAKEFLTSDLSVAARKDVLLAALNSIDSQKAVTAQEFITAWPMYLDGGAHKNVRSKLNKALISYRGRNPANYEGFLTKAFEQSDLVDEAMLVGVIQKWRSTVFGFSLEELIEIERLGQPILELLLNDELGCFEEAHESMGKLEAIVEYSASVSDGLVAHMAAAGCSAFTVLNVILDSYAPVLNGAKLTLLQYQSYHMANTQMIEETEQVVDKALTQSPPFRFINRRIKDKLHDWYSIDLLACCRGEEMQRSRMYFGIGSHYCPGAALAHGFLSALLRVFIETSAERNPCVSGKIVERSGMCDVDDFAISFG